MNVVEHYIEEIHSESEHEDEYGKFVDVDVTVNCYGNKMRMKTYFKPKEWEEVKQKGYFLG